MNTQATKNLFTLRHRPYSVSAKTCHPDTERTVMLVVKPRVKKRAGVYVLARYKDGNYYDINTDLSVSVDLEQAVWMECPYCEGPYFVGNVTANTVANDIVKDTVFHDIKVASLHVNELNMGSFGNPTYTVVNADGILIDHEGFYTQHSIPVK